MPLKARGPAMNDLNRTAAVEIVSCEVIGKNGARPVCNGIRLALFALVGAAASGCATIHDQFKETGPATTMSYQTPSSADIIARYQGQPEEPRTWPQMTAEVDPSVVVHGPLYFEDPFVDQGTGRTDEKNPNNVYRIGWIDAAAVPYEFGRFAINLVGLPVSMVVYPPWQAQESDGLLSKQLLDYERDAVPVGVEQRHDHGVVSTVDSAGTGTDSPAPPSGRTATSNGSGTGAAPPQSSSGQSSDSSSVQIRTLNQSPR